MTTNLARPAVDARSAVRRPGLVALLCWALIVFDGYDLTVFGTTLTALLNEPGWGLTPSSAGFIGSLAIAGMLLGALGAGRLADGVGRRRTILTCTLWFSVFTGLCAFASSPEAFGALRFLAGLGLGGLVPSANTLTSEFVRARRRPMAITILMSGAPIGGAAGALLDLWMLPTLGWRAMYAVAFVGVVVLLPLTVVLLPESPTWLRAKGRTDEAEHLAGLYGLEPPAVEEQGAGAGVGFAALLRGRWLVPTALFSLATVATLFTWYGLGTWLPKLMASDVRFEMGRPLSFLLALNLGAVLGSFITAAAGVRFGPLRSAVAAAAGAALALGFLLTYPTSLSAIYGALILAGVGTHGTQCLIVAAVTTHYPATLRGTSLGFALGVGRIGAVAAPQVGGLLLDAGLGVGANFLVFSLAAAVAAALLAITALVTAPAANRPVAPALAH